MKFRNSINPEQEETRVVGRDFAIEAEQREHQINPDSGIVEIWKRLQKILLDSRSLPLKPSMYFADGRKICLQLPEITLQRSQICFEDIWSIVDFRMRLND